MKILPFSDGSVAKEVASAAPVKVCMHVWSVGRTDMRVLREATTLVEAGFAVSIVDLERERTCPAEEEIRGIRMNHIISPSSFVPTRFKPWFLIKFVLTTIRGILRLAQTPADIYHAHEEVALPACYIAARVRRKPLIFDAHELPLSEANVRRWRRLHALATRLLALMLPYCAGVITISPPIAQEIRRHYHVSEVTLIRNFSVRQIVSKSDRLRQYLGVKPHVRIALYQGYLQPDRGLDKLIRAAPFLEQDIIIVLMGKAGGATQTELEALITSEGVADRVKMLPPAPYTELLSWTASADIGLILYAPEYSLNTRFCLPNKLFEYLMAGLPVLASRLDAVAEVISTYDVGQVVSSLVPADIATAINAMLADQVALDRMRRNALEAVKDELCWEKEGLRLMRLYHDILAKFSQQPGASTRFLDKY